jgi:hypothetical protein
MRDAEMLLGLSDLAVKLIKISRNCSSLMPRAFLLGKILARAGGLGRQWLCGISKRSG